MKILVIDKSIIGSKLTDVSGSLIRHLEFWHAGYNQIDLLARADENITHKLRGKVNFLKLSRIYFLNLFYSYYYLVFKSKSYDLVIEAWKDKPFFPLIFNTRRSLVAIFSSDYKNVLPVKLIRFIYKKSRFLVNSYTVREKLLKTGFKSGIIKLCPDGTINNSLKSEKYSTKKKNKILIICSKDFRNIISIVGLIERKSLDWKFVVLIEKKNVQKFKKVYKESDLTSKFKIIPFSLSVFNKNVENSRFLLITKDIKKITDYIIGAFVKNTPVILEGRPESIEEKRNRGIIIKYEDQMDAAGKILSLSKNESEYEKLLKKISKSSKIYTWEEVGEASLKFIESL